MDAAPLNSRSTPDNDSKKVAMPNDLTLIPADTVLQPLITYLAVGWDKGLEQQLLTKSRQASILQYTPKDAGQRFGSPAMLEHWRAKGREIHWLLGANHDLAGIIWYGKSPFPLDAQQFAPQLMASEVPQETFAIRLYDGYAGHGLARPFMQQSLRVHVQHQQANHQPVSGVWLQTDITNPAAIAAYIKFGYQEVIRDNTRVTMMMPPATLLAIAGHE
jgi:hypothetical protein